MTTETRDIGADGDEERSAEKQAATPSVRRTSYKAPLKDAPEPVAMPTTHREAVDQAVEQLQDEANRVAKAEKDGRRKGTPRTAVASVELHTKKGILLWSGYDMGAKKFVNIGMTQFAGDVRALELAIRRTDDPYLIWRLLDIDAKLDEIEQAVQANEALLNELFQSDADKGLFMVDNMGIKGDPAVVPVRFESRYAWTTVRLLTLYDKQVVRGVTATHTALADRSRDLSGLFTGTTRLFHALFNLGKNLPESGVSRRDFVEQSNAAIQAAQRFGVSPPEDVILGQTWPRFLSPPSPLQASGPSRREEAHEEASPEEPPLGVDMLDLSGAPDLSATNSPLTDPVVEDPATSS